MAVIQHALDQGIRFLDSADMYGWGHNETLVGKALEGRREGLVLASKFGQTRQPGSGNGVDGSPAYVQAACEASLKRLGLDVIDLYYVHRIDPNVPIEDTVGAMARLIERGKVHSADEFANDRHKDHARFHAGNFERNRALAAFIETMAKEKSCQSGQLALAWLLAQGADIVPIPGTKQAARIDENLGALDVQLSDEERKALSNAFPRGAAAGTRYPATGMTGVFI